MPISILEAIPHAWFLASHSEFQSWLQKQISARLSTHAPALKLHASLLEKVFALNLDHAKPIMAELYSATGRPALLQPEILRALFVMTHLKVASITQFIKTLPANEILAIACGFEPVQIPPVGSFYALTARLWPGGPNPNRLRKPFPPRSKKKPKTGQKLQPQHPGMVQKLVEAYLKGRRLQNSPERYLQRIFAECAVLPSARLGLLGNLDDLVIVGDGAPLRTGASPFGQKVCHCKDQGIFRCKCPRRYSDLQANWGWDSYHEQWFYGYTLYSITSAHSPNDLPLLLRLVQASRHDSISFVFAFGDLLEFYPQLRPGKALLDSAHDANAIYQLLYHHQIQPFIDLNPKNQGNRTYPAPIEFDETGAPICPAGHKMKHWGFDKKRVRIKWRCPFHGKSGHICPDKETCSPSAYGRTVYTKPAWDLRTFTPIPRNSQVWKKIYNRRTSVERTFKRILVDYRVEDARVRGKGRWFCRVILAAINQHLDAQLAKTGALFTTSLGLRALEAA